MIVHLYQICFLGFRSDELRGASEPQKNRLVIPAKSQSQIIEAFDAETGELKGFERENHLSSAGLISSFYYCSMHTLLT